MLNLYSQNPSDFPKSKMVCTIGDCVYPRLAADDPLYNDRIVDFWYEAPNVLKNFNKEDKCPIVWADGCALLGQIETHTIMQRRMWNPHTRMLDTIANLKIKMVIYHVHGKEMILPFNPTGRTGTIGRGILGKYGPNHAVDALITYVDKNGDMWVFCIVRADTQEYALVGGMVDPGEKISTAAVEREFKEEILNNADMGNFMIELKKCRQEIDLYKGVVDDWRNTDNAWIETDVFHYDLDEQTKALLKPTPDPTEVIKAGWHKATDAFCDRMYASHGQWVKTVRDITLAKKMVPAKPSPKRRIDDISDPEPSARSARFARR